MDNHQLNCALTRNNNIQYWSSYKDHKKKILKEISDYENDINESKKYIDELKEEYDEVCKEEKEFKETNYVPSHKFSSIEIEENPEFCEKAIQLIKVHELKYHRDLIGRYTICDKGGHFHSNAKYPTYHFIGSGNNLFKIKYIVCYDCLKNAIINGEISNTHYTMNIEEDIGSSQ